MSAPPSEVAELLSFATEFWQAVGARLTREENSFRVELTDELARHFGKDVLRFALTANDAWASGAEILAPGSFLLERMHDFLQDKGTRAVFYSPAREAPSPSEVRRQVAARVEAGNARLDGLSSSEAWPVRIAIDFKVTYHSDEREEELVRVVEGHDGALRTAEAAPCAPWPDAEAASGEMAARLSVSRLPARYDELVAVARRHALERARGLEKAALARLTENLARLRGYFTQIRGEIGGDEERRAERLRELEDEERLKTEEEIDAHRLRVRIVPVSMALLAVPTRRVTLAFEGTEPPAEGASGPATAELQCDWNLATGTLEAAGFGPVGAEALRLSMCRGQHLVRRGEARPCAACGRSSCTEHGSDCPAGDGACGAHSCVPCASRCLLCERRYCREHAPRPCVACGRASCAECGAPCATCGAVACRDDSTACAVCARRSCAEHAVRCGCGETVCQEHVVVDSVSGIRYCGKCAILCADCGRPIGKATSSLCAGCGARLCRDDARPCALCGRPAAKLCRAHRARCNACGRDVCRTRHRRRCRMCAQEACPTCLDSAGRCALCLQLHRSKEKVAGPRGDKLPADVASARDWRRQEGAEHDLFLAKAAGGPVMVVVDKQGAVVKVLRK